MIRTEFKRVGTILKRITFLSCSLFILSSCYSQDNAEELTAEEQITALLKRYPGLSVAVGIGEELVYEKGFGFANVEEQLSVTPEHRFRYYSLSKSITGMALIKLIAEGRLDIEHSVRHYLGSLPEHYEEVKVKHLIGHIAGVRHYNRGEWDEISSESCNTTGQAISTFINDPLESAPGEKFKYSSFGYVLLSHLITKVSGMPYEVYLNQEIFLPNQVSTIHNDGAVESQNEVSYYSLWIQKRGKSKESRPANNSCKYGGGGFVGTAADLVRLHLAMVNGKVANKELTKTYYTGIPPTGGETGTYAFGVGDARTESSGYQYHFHSGSARGANAALLVWQPRPDFDKPVVVVIMGNLKSDKMNSAIGDISNAFRRNFAQNGKID